LSCHLADAFRHLKTACPASADLAFLFEEGTTMTIPEAKAYVGKDCSVTWRDRHGKEQIMTTHIHDVTFVPLYGACLVGDVEDIYLEKVTRIQPLN
jgi:hypothetical protein